MYLINTKVPTGGFSTETGLVNVTNDLLLSLDKTKSTFYFVVDLSAAFDTLAHELILSILEIGFQRGWGFKD